jgi:hypothetical protein
MLQKEKIKRNNLLEGNSYEGKKGVFEGFFDSCRCGNDGKPRSDHGPIGLFSIAAWAQRILGRPPLLHGWPRTSGIGESSTGFNVGAVINLTENHHILVSAGRDFDGPNLFTAYLGYQYTFSSKEQKTSMLLQPKK